MCIHTYIHIGERPAAWLGATFRRPAYMYWWTRSQNALTVTYEKIVRAMVERCESGQKWAHFFFCASYHLAWLLPSLGGGLLPSHGLRCWTNISLVAAAAAAAWRYGASLCPPPPARKSGASSSLHDPLTTGTTEKEKKRERERCCSFEQIYRTMGLISADRSNKATLLLTIPRSIKVVCNGFISSNIWN